MCERGFDNGHGEATDLDMSTTNMSTAARLRELPVIIEQEVGQDEIMKRLLK